jgi:oligoribonuclease
VDKLLWIDMEMTGLDVEKEVIIEVAAVVTDMHFQSLYRYHAIVCQPQSYLDAMDAWNKKHHTDSGLAALVPSGKSPDQVESDLMVLLDTHFPDERAVLAGNSIAQDRLFINKYFTRFAPRLHYRALDVTSFKVVFVNCFGVTYEKRGAHRAVDDIAESIAELQHYLSYVSGTPKRLEGI